MLLPCYTPQNVNSKGVYFMPKIKRSVIAPAYVYWDYLKVIVGFEMICKNMYTNFHHLIALKYEDIRPKVAIYNKWFLLLPAGWYQ